MQKYPVGGPREPVYALLRGLGFSMAKGLGDKHWQSADGLEVHIYGAGSMARVYQNGLEQADCRLDDINQHIDALRTDWRKGN